MADERPPVWVGHVAMSSSDVAKTTDFLVKLGLRFIEGGEQVSVLELRGGTHLVVLQNDNAVLPGTQASFDLMYEDVDVIWKQCNELGLSPSAIRDEPFHRSFTLIEPGGHEITVNSTHASDLPV